MAIHCIVAEIKRDIGRKSRFLHIPSTHNNLPEKKTVADIFALFSQPSQIPDQSDSENSPVFSHFTRLTDGK